MFYKKRIPRFSKLSAAITSCLHREKNIAGTPIPSISLLQEIRNLTASENNTRVYVDTCTLLHESGLELLDAVNMVLSTIPDQYLLILTSVVFELQNVGRKNPSKSKHCKMIIDKLNLMKLNGSVKFITTSSPEFSDAGFISRFVTESQVYDVILLTQDRSLAQKVTHLPSFLDGCVNNTHTIRVFRLTSNGNLTPFDGTNNSREEDHYEKHDVRQPIPFHARQGFASAVCKPHGRYPAVYFAGGTYPRFYVETDSDEYTGRFGG